MTDTLRRCIIAVYWDGKGGIIMKIAIIYYSQTGHTREMGSVIAEGIERAGGEARLFSIEEPIDQERGCLRRRDHRNSDLGSQYLLAD